MTAFCYNCNKKVDYKITEAQETEDIKGTMFSMMQKHAFCRECGEEVLPEEIVNENVAIAHDAYRNAIGSITVKEIRSILDKYNIGAKPLSQLLGWGENTIERQMKHTIPDKEYTEQLRRLNNPFNMVELLVKNGDNIPRIAFLKAALEAIKQTEQLIKFTSIYHSSIRFNSFYDSKDISGEVSFDTMNKESNYTISYSSSPYSDLSRTKQFNIAFAA